MYWQEEVDEAQFLVPDRVVDMIFKINCPTLPVDHAWVLSETIHQQLPWFPEETLAGLHLIYGAESGNGWERPSQSDASLYLSRRTPLILRLPKERVEQAHALTGKTLNISGHALQVGMAHTRLLSMTSTLYCRHMVTESDQSEEAFLQIAVEQLQARGVGFKKILCGKGSFFSSPQGGLSTRSLMVAGLSLDDAVTLQEQGLGPLRSRGFGLFIPHKTV